MMSLASLSAAAVAAISASSTALVVAVTCGIRPPQPGTLPLASHAPGSRGSAAIQPNPARRQSPPARPASLQAPGRYGLIGGPSQAQSDPSLGPARCPVAVAVQPALGDVLHYAVRDQVPDRLTPAHPLPALGGRDGQGRDLDEADLVTRQPGGA